MKLLLSQKHKKTLETIFYIFIILLSNIHGVQTLTSIVFNYQSTIYKIINCILYIVLLGCFFLSIPYIIFRVHIWSIIIYSVFLCLSIFTYVYSDASRTVFTQETLWLSIFVFSISAIILIPEIRNIDLFMKVLKIYSLILILYATFVLINSDIGNAYMGFSYAFLLYVIVLLYYGLFKKELVPFIFGLLGSIVDIIGGARGSIICLLGFFVAYLVLSKKRIICCLLLILIIFCYIHFDSILYFVISITDQFNIDSRILNALQSSSLSYDNGRDIISEVCINLIQNHPFGFGFLGERVPINNSVWWFGTNGYAHNILLELLLQYGVILGIIIIFCLIYLISLFIKKFNQNDNLYALTLIYCCYNLHLFVSRSYTTTFTFWALMACLYMICVEHSSRYLKLTNKRW